ncbi:hypothetical protein T484DRAFT_1789802 [Baffinella frigidus]|nr:hypothetical protein T484DRAFT_1789802 [Cryptophyta sp. CCMP2293]
MCDDMFLSTPRRALAQSADKENVTPRAAEDSPSLAKTVRNPVDVEGPAATFSVPFSQAQCTPQPPAASFHSQGPTFDINKILSHEIRSGEVVYLVRWRGYSSLDDSWEPEPAFLAQQGGRVAIGEYREKNGIAEQIPPLSTNDAARVAKSLLTHNHPRSAPASKTGAKGSVKDHFPVLRKKAPLGQEQPPSEPEPALSREERKMAAIMKQFEELEKTPEHHDPRHAAPLGEEREERKLAAIMRHFSQMEKQPKHHEPKHDPPLSTPTNHDPKHAAVAALCLPVARSHPPAAVGGGSQKASVRPEPEERKIMAIMRQPPQP